MAITRACIQRELSEFFVSLFNGQSFALTGQPVVSKRDGELGNVKYKDCSVCNWIRETTVTSQMRIQEKAIWKKFVFGFYSIKNQKLIFFKKYFRSFFLSVWGIKWVHNLKFFIYLCGYALSPTRFFQFQVCFTLGRDEFASACVCVSPLEIMLHSWEKA